MNQSYKILAVNDEPDQLDLLETILRQAGYNVVGATNGSEAYEVARREQPGLIISDVMMPDTDGIDLCRLVRSDNKLRSIPILLVSGVRKDTASIVEAFESGADDYMQIPYVPVHLVAKATRLLERRRMQEEAMLASGNRFRNLIENLTDIISVLAPDGTIIYESPSLENVLGFKSEEVIGKNAFELIHPEDFEKVTTYFENALQKFAPTQPIQYRFRHKDNSWRLIESIGKPFDDPVKGQVAIINSRDITEQQAAQEALRMSEERFQLASLATEDALWDWDLTTDELWLSDSFYELLGYLREEVDPHINLWYEVLHPDDKERVISRIHKVIESGERFWSDEYRMRRADGDYAYIFDRGYIVHDDDGKPIRMIGAAINFTERKQAEQQIRRQLNFIEAITKTMAEGICTYDREGRVTFINPAAAEMLGWSADEIIGRNIHQTIHCRKPDGAEFPVEDCPLMNIFKTGESVRGFEDWFIRKDGMAFQVVCSSVPLVTNGEITSAVQTFHDITERKQIENSLRENKEHLAMAHQAAQMGSFDWNVQNQTIILSPELEVLYGFSPGEATGAYEEWESRVHPEDRAQAKKAIENALETGIYKSEFRIVLRNEEPRWIQSRGKVFYDDENKPLRMVGVSKDVTENKLAELTLRFQKTLLEAQSEASIDGILVVSPTGEIVSHNRRLLEMWGISEEALHAKSDETILKQITDKLTAPQEFIEAVYYLYKHPDVKDQVEISLKDGRTFERYTAPVIDADNTHFGRVWFFRDITKHKEVKEAIRFQAHLLDTVEQAVIATDLRGIVTYWNRFAETLYGWTAAEAVGRNILELTAPDFSQKQASEIMARLSKGESWSGEFTVRSKKGDLFPGYVCSSPVLDGKGKLIGIVGISNDITERKNAEKAIAEANQRALREYDRLLKRLTKLAETAGSARDLLTIFRAILEFARAAIPCTGFFISLYDAEKQVRKPAYAWDSGSQEFDVSTLPLMAMSDSPHSRAVLTGEIVIENDFQKATIGQPVINIGLDKDPNLPQSCLVVPMAFMGRIVGAVEAQSTRLGAYTTEHATAMQMAANLAANAIENVRLLEQERERAEQLRQAQKLESVGRLAGGIAHDFNNMLTAINGYSDLTLRRLKEDDPLRRNIEEIKKAGERSAALTHQLLAFSRKQVLKPKVLDINEVVVDTSKLLQRLIGEDVQLSIVSNQRVGRIEVDPGQLTQVIVNLAVNARDAMPNGGSLTIETSNVYLDKEYAALHYPTKPGHYVMLAVSDTGVGIEEEVLQHIFEPFYTTKEVGKGTGLGLSTVYGIVKQSNGYIWVYSEVGKGTTFKIYFPRIDSKAAEEERSEKTENIPKGSETILLVEDEDAVRGLARQILESCGYQIMEARNGAEAIELYEKTDCRIDLLITDVVMPKMGGRELAEKIAGINPQIKQLFMSGYTDDGIIRQGMIAENMDFIQKPFTFEALAQKVREVLDAGN
jgi:PAS domain S-box-containing protein